MSSIYIHIPFCKKKCLYCDFNSYSKKEGLISNYIGALKKEIQSFNLNVQETIYFGGGTPSYIDKEYIKEILQLIPHDDNTEITIEVNPGTVDYEKLKDYYDMGINRLSIGLQATQEKILKEIGRIHTLDDFENTYNTARKIGFKNISVDLMFGLPDQTLNDVKESLEYVISLNPEHISFYSLILHDNHTFKNLPSDEMEREMYYYIMWQLREEGYIQYEISNFAKPTYESKHNMVYWNQREYIGVGAGASSYIKNVRCTNESDIENYIEDILKGGTATNVDEIQTPKTKLDEYMILQLRLLEGVDINKANEKFNVNILERYNKIIDKMTKLKLIEIKENHIRLTEKGLDLANVVWEEFV